MFQLSQDSFWADPASLTDMLVPAASLFLLPGLVVSFTFPGDWHKIRQMMEARREAEAEVISELILTIYRIL